MPGLHAESRCEIPHVLVVDDDAPTVRMIQFLLEQEGFLVSCTADPESALEEYLRQCVDLVLLNVTMPDADGFDLYDRLIELGYRGPVVFVTTRSDVPEMLLERRIGRASCLVKPLYADEVIRLIRRLLPYEAESAAALETGLSR